MSLQSREEIAGEPKGHTLGVCTHNPKRNLTFIISLPPLHMAGEPQPRGQNPAQGGIPGHVLSWGRHNTHQWVSQTERLPLSRPRPGYARSASTLPSGGHSPRAGKQQSSGSPQMPTVGHEPHDADQEGNFPFPILLPSPFLCLRGYSDLASMKFVQMGT